MIKSIFLSLCLVCVTGLGAVSSHAQAPRKRVLATEVNGTFRKNFTGKFRGSSNEIKILALGGGKLRIAMELIYPYVVNGELSANMGELDGTASIVGETAIYQSTEFGTCKITIKFVRPGRINVTQEGSDADCGFGHNVNSGGTYRKVSSRKPGFDTNK